jgi:hypothetical protein
MKTIKWYRERGGAAEERRRNKGGRQKVIPFAADGRAEHE